MNEKKVFTVETVLKLIKASSSEKGRKSQEYFGIKGINNFGLTVPQMRTIAKEIGKNHSLALSLWKSGVHEARHIAVMIADSEKVSEKLMETWIRDFNSWDIVDNCTTLFCKHPIAFSKAKEWTAREKEFEKRAGFSLMAMLAVHDKKSADSEFESFFPFINSESGDARNFVRKAINWALRQIGKRNVRLCKKAIEQCEGIKLKSDSSSRWIASDALRELKKYLNEDKIKDVGRK